MGYNHAIDSKAAPSDIGGFVDKQGKQIDRPEMGNKEYEARVSAVKGRYLKAKYYLMGFRAFPKKWSGEWHPLYADLKAREAGALAAMKRFLIGTIEPSYIKQIINNGKFLLRNFEREHPKAKAPTIVNARASIAQAEDTTAKMVDRINAGLQVPELLERARGFEKLRAAEAERVRADKARAQLEAKIATKPPVSKYAAKQMAKHGRDLRAAQNRTAEMAQNRQQAVAA